MSDVPAMAPVRAYVQARRAAVFQFELYPQLWERSGLSREMRKEKWNYVYFNPANRIKIPAEAGIYMFVVAPRHAYLRDHTYIFYVGQTDNLNRRYQNYLDEEFGEDLELDREKLVDFLNYFKGHIFFNFFTCPKADLDKKEYYLVDHIFPWANSRHKKGIKTKVLASHTL